MLQRPMGTLRGAAGPVPGGNRVFDGRSVFTIDGNDKLIPVEGIVAGVINRTGLSGGTTDSLPSVSQIVTAIPELNSGDSIFFSIRMADAQTNTVTAGAGMTAVGTINVAASSIRDYLLTLTSGPTPTVLYAANTTNTSKDITGLTAEQLKTLSVGMAVTGSGVGSQAVIEAINYDTLTVQVSVASTATGTGVALTFTPQATLFSMGTRGI